MSHWRVHGRRLLYDSPWVRLELADVELEPGLRIEHHAVRAPAESVATVVRQDGRILMLYRHRFIPDIWGWEVPAGRIEPGATIEEAALQETLEETGWRPRRPRLVASGYPAPGLTDLRHHVCVAVGADYEGAPVHAYEAERVDWLDEDEVGRLLRDGQVPDGYTQYALLAAGLRPGSDAALRRARSRAPRS